MGPSKEVLKPGRVHERDAPLARRARLLQEPAMIEGLIRFAERNQWPQEPEAFARQARAASNHDARDRLGRIKASTSSWSASTTWSTRLPWPANWPTSSRGRSSGPVGGRTPPPRRGQRDVSGSDSRFHRTRDRRPTTLLNGGLGSGDAPHDGSNRGGYRTVATEDDLKGA